MKRPPLLLWGMFIGFVVGVYTIPPIASSYEERLYQTYWIPGAIIIGLIAGLAADVYLGVRRRRS